MLKEFTKPKDFIEDIAKTSPRLLDHIKIERGRICGGWFAPPDLQIYDHLLPEDLLRR
jgi:hypothetical protein